MTVTLENARLEEQRRVMEQIVADGLCPFCEENLSRYHKNPIVRRKYWLVTDSQWPYEDTEHHILLISRTHAEKLEELEAKARIELIEIVDELIRDRGISGGGFCMRFGDSARSGSTVNHLHAHIIAPEEGASAMFFMGKRKED